MSLERADSERGAGVRGDLNAHQEAGREIRATHGPAAAVRISIYSAGLKGKLNRGGSKLLSR